MKNLFITLGNLFIWYILCFSSFFGILWYGKLPKKSFYHWNRRDCNLFDLYNDANCQVKSVEDVPQRIKGRIINDYISKLYDNDTFINNVAGIDIPIFDGKKIIGKSGVNQVLQDVKDNYLKN